MSGWSHTPAFMPIPGDDAGISGEVGAMMMRRL